MSCSSRCASPVPGDTRAPCPRRRAVAIWFGAGLLPFAGAARARSTPPAAVVRALGTPRLAGGGVFRWWGLEVYRASLWVGPAGLDSDDLGAQPFALQLHYARSLSGRAIADESTRLIDRLDLGSTAQRRAWQARMRAIFPDVHAGDSLTGLYLGPTDGGARTDFLLDGHAIGSIGGRTFAVAFFSIWLSRHSAAPELRRALLAGARPTP